MSFAAQLSRLINVVRSDHWFVVIAGMFLLLTIFSRAKRSAQTSDRRSVLGAMGFVDISRDQAFPTGPNAVARAIYDFPAASISGWVGKGTSAIGETLLFDFTYDVVPGRANADTFTVLAFRVPETLPDWDIHHLLLLDRLFKKSTVRPAPPASSTDNGDQSGPAPARHSQADNASKPDRSLAIRLSATNEIAIESNPAFAKRYVVLTNDEHAMRRILTPAFIEALTSMNDGTLNLRKVADWLFVYRWSSQPTAPQHYSALVEEAATLVGLLDLRFANSKAV